MRCHICDTRLTPAEIEYEQDYQQWKPCGTCIDISGTSRVSSEDKLNQLIDDLLGDLPDEDEGIEIKAIPVS